MNLNRVWHHPGIVLFLGQCQRGGDLLMQGGWVGGSNVKVIVLNNIFFLLGGYCLYSVASYQVGRSKYKI